MALRPFESDDSERSVPISLDEARARGVEYRSTGAFQNALDLYRAFNLNDELNSLATDAWLAGAFDICREALEYAGNVRRLLAYAKSLGGFPSTARMITSFERAATDVRRARRRMCERQAGS